IRDFHVTGVQTCALPISHQRPAPAPPCRHHRTNSPGGNRSRHRPPAARHRCTPGTYVRSRLPWFLLCLHLPMVTYAARPYVNNVVHARAGRRPPSGGPAPITTAKGIRMRIANVLAMGLLAALVPRVGAGSDLPLDAIKLPPSFRIDIYADDVPDARSLALGDQGTLFVSTRRQGVIYALRDRDGDQRAEAKYVIASDLNTPNG